MFDTEVIRDGSIDALMVVLLHGADRTHLPELYEVFGKEALVRFLDVFAGVTFRVPRREELERAVRDVRIYTQIRSARAGSRAATVRALAQEYGVETVAIRAVHGRIADIVEGMS